MGWGNVVRDEERIVRPPEFKKVLEEMHVVRLGDNLKSEIQARRDLEDVYHRLLRDVADLEDTIEEGRSDIERANATADRAHAAQAIARSDSVILQKRLTRLKVACYCLLAIVAVFIVFAWEDLWTTFLTVLQSLA